MSADCGIWRILPFTTGSAERQLAQTEALWRAVAAGEAPETLRWYGYDAPAVVLGVGQRETALDQAACREARTAVVRRASGGAAVLANGAMLALDVALPAASPLAAADVVESYRWLGMVLAAALRGLAPYEAGRIVLVGAAEARADQQAQQAAQPRSAGALRGLACFGTLSPYEVALARPDSAPPAKLVGLSQVRKRGVVLFQVGVYARWRGADLAGLLMLAPEERHALAGELDRRIASLTEIGLGTVDLPALMTAVNAGATEALKRG